MNKSDVNYIKLALLHVGIAIVLFYIPFLSKIYALLIAGFGTYYIIVNNNRNNEVLYVSAYLVGAEVFIRMTGGNLNNEYVKVVVSLLMLLGFVLSGFSKSNIVYWLYLFLLLPSVLITMSNEDLNLEIRKAITFNISGPICLGLCALYCYRRQLTYSQLQNIIVLFGLPIIATLTFGVWSYSVIQTRGLISKRYANQDVRGRVKGDRLGGREVILGSELELFKENPILGVGIGMGKSYRAQMLGEEVASHNEITRLLAEHGMFGVAILLILLLAPFILFLGNYQNIYFFSFYVFWLLTINHAAMRTAAPAFVYALTLLRVQLKQPEIV